MLGKDQRRNGVIVALALVLHVAMGAVPLLAQSSGEQRPTNETPAEWTSVESAMGRKGQLQGGTLKFGMPRSDLKVLVGGLPIKPALALGSWVAFDSPGKDALMMGDLVLTENEIAPVMAGLRNHGIEITALHNHVIQESPRVLYMHVSAHGDAPAIAREIRAALSLTGTPAPVPGAQGEIALDVPAIERVMGYQGKVNGGVLQLSVPRSEAITEHGRRIPASMGVATAMNFQPAGGGRGAVTQEVNPVIDSLTGNHITVTALHSHMLEENPRLFFLHFWAVDDAVKLARALRETLDKTNSAKAPLQ